MKTKSTGLDHDIADSLGIPPGQLKAEMDAAALERMEISHLRPRISEDGKEWQLALGDEVIISESTETPYPYMQRAWAILTGGVPAAWKTVAFLRTFRQAIREATAQGMPLEIPAIGAGLDEMEQFLEIARAFDAVHHGGQTF